MNIDRRKEGWMGRKGGNGRREGRENPWPQVIMKFTLKDGANPIRITCEGKENDERVGKIRS